MPQIVFINIAKAIGIILVVVGHYYPEDSPGWYVGVHDVIYSFHMPLFMFASGYVYIATLRSVSYYHFITKKVKRLLVPYWSVSVLVISIKLLSSRASLAVDHPVSVWSYVEMLYRPTAGAFLWFVLALFLMFAILPLFRTPRARLWLFGGSLILKYLPLIVPVEYPKFFCIGSCISMLPFFMLGVVVYEHRTKLALWSRVHSGVVYGAFLISSACVVMWPEDRAVGLIAPYIGIAAVTRVCLWLERRDSSRPVALLLTIGAASYTIYLWHTTFQGFAKAVMHKVWPQPGEWLFVLAAVVVISVGVTVPRLLHTGVFKRYRVTRFLFGA